QVIAVTDSVPEDSALATLAAADHEAARGRLAEVVGQAAREIGSPRGRFDDGPLWELIQRAELGASGADVSLAALPDTAARIAAGPVTRRDLLRACVYENRLVAVELTGEQLRQALEQSAGALAAYTYESGRPLLEPGVPGYRLDAAEGVGYEIDLARPAGDRVRNLTFHGAPLAPERRLKVALNSFRANGGGGGPEFLHAAPRLWGSTGTIPEILAEFARGKTLDGSFTRNWTLLPDYARTRERPLIDLLVRQGVAPKGE